LQHQLLTSRYEDGGSFSVWHVCGRHFLDEENLKLAHQIESGKTADKLKHRESLFLAMTDLTGLTGEVGLAYQPFFSCTFVCDGGIVKR